MIVVCDSIPLSEVFFEHISGERTVQVETAKGKPAKQVVRETGHVFPELLSNTDVRQPTMRIDSKLIKDAESGEDSRSRGAAGDELRRRVSTVGKLGEPGEQVRCVVSVGMLTEGWDANNVKQILGLRAFDSQLLCEQVVGRGLRRMSYDVDPETGLLSEEYVDVYGVPFEVIPVKRKPVASTGPEEKDKTLVQAVPKRASLAIEFPLVEGYVYEVGEHIRADVAAIPHIEVDPKVEPTQVISRPKAWVEGGGPSLIGPGETVRQTREEYYATVRMRAIEFDLAGRIVDGLTGGRDREGKQAFRYRSAHQLFPQVLAIVREFLETRVDYRGANRKEIGLERYRKQIEERLLQAIEPDEGRGEAAILPRIERFRQKGSTRDVSFFTVRPCRPTLKSHIDHVVLDSEVWEGSAAFELEASPHVASYARNDHLGFTIPTSGGAAAHLHAGLLVRLTNGLR